MNNKNLPFGQNAMQFEPYAHKSEKDKYFGLFSFLWQSNINWFRGVCLTWKDLGWNIFLTSRSYCGNCQETYSQTSNWGGQERSEILSIPNKYKDTLENLGNSLDVEHPAIPRQIDLSSNDIPGFKNDSSDPEMNDDLLDKSQRQ